MPRVDEVKVRPATRADVPALSKALGRAFFDDPVMMWLLPDDDARRRKLHRLFASLTRHHHLAYGGVEVASDGATIVGAALWDPPGHWQETRVEELRAMPGLLFTFGAALNQGRELTELMKAAHPEEPHWYLAVIGSDPNVRGAGFGRALMQSRLDRVDAEHAPSYLESSNEVNVPYYLRFGFKVTGEITVPNGGPTLWQMWRDPR
jgi:GNAT superfamily N-acetyltransferase